MYIHVIKYVFSFHCTRISTLSITCFHITEYVFLHHQIHISISPNTHFRSPFRGYIHICGHDKSAPTAANGLPKHCERIAITQRTHTKCPTNTPSGVGADSSRPCPNIIKYTYSHYQICTFTSSHTHFHIINYVYSRHQIRVSVSTHTHFHIIKYVYSFHQICAFTSSHAHFYITKYVYSHY